LVDTKDKTLVGFLAFITSSITLEGAFSSAPHQCFVQETNRCKTNKAKEPGLASTGNEQTTMLYPAATNRVVCKRESNSELE
jgi:hypothetical protein